jgi:hypothetical protein
VYIEERMEAIGAFSPHPWQDKENPQAYSLIKEYGQHPKPSQHGLGLVGGNEVYMKDRASQVSVESDLRGITRANTFCPERAHLPSDNKDKIVRDTPKGKVSISVPCESLGRSQLWAYPATLGPEPFRMDVCDRPEKY